MRTLATLFVLSLLILTIYSLADCIKNYIKSNDNFYKGFGLILTFYSFLITIVLIGMITCK